MSNQQKKPRYVYEYNNQKYEVPQHFIYSVHNGGHDINEAFFTWAFNIHDISIMDIQVVYANTDRTLKGDKKNSAASSTFFIATVTGQDKRKIIKVGDGESGNESITNFQRGYPAGLAIKRAKVNMGKEFFNLVDLKMALDCRDFTIEFGNEKGKTLEELSRTPQGIGTIQWLASDKFTGDGMLKLKAQEFLFLYAGGPAVRTDYSIGRAVNEPMPIPQQGNSAPHSNPNAAPVQNQPPQQAQQTTQGQPMQQGGYPNPPQGQGQNAGQQPAQQGGGYTQPPQGQPQGTYNAPPSQAQGGYTQPPQGQPQGQPTVPSGMTAEQNAVLTAYKTKKFMTKEQINAIAIEMFGPAFTWPTATFEQGNMYIQRLQQQFGPV